jgi:hypothetical protein
MPLTALVTGSSGDAFAPTAGAWGPPPERATVRQPLAAALPTLPSNAYRVCTRSLHFVPLVQNPLRGFLPALPASQFS